MNLITITCAMNTVVVAFDVLNRSRLHVVIFFSYLENIFRLGLRKIFRHRLSDVIPPIIFHVERHSRIECGK